MHHIPQTKYHNFILLSCEPILIIFGSDVKRASWSFFLTVYVYSSNWHCKINVDTIRCYLDIADIIRTAHKDIFVHGTVDFVHFPPKLHSIADTARV